MLLSKVAILKFNQVEKERRETVTKLIEAYWEKSNILMKVLSVCAGALVILHILILLFKIGYFPQVLFTYIVWSATFVLSRIYLSKNILVNVFLASLAAGSWLFFPNWLTIDIAGLMIVAMLFATLKVSLRSIVLIAVGMTMYDFIAVYCLDSMVTAAKAAIENNLPICFIIPKSFSLHDNSRLFLLGLGDIFIPGLIVKSEIEDNRDKYWWLPRTKRIRLTPLFLIGGQILGIGLAFVSAIFFKQAQPALIFIIPIMLLILAMKYLVTTKDKSLKDF